MRISIRPLYLYLSLFALCGALGVSQAQSIGNSGSVSGTVADPTGAVVANAEIEIRNSVSGFERTTSTDAAGKFSLTNVPFNPYHLSVRLASIGDMTAGWVAGAVPFGDGTNPIDLAATGLTADQEFQAGLICNGQRATPTVALPDTCAASQFTSNLVTIPVPGTENDDHNPPRIAPRHLFDVAVGHDNLFHSHNDRFKVSGQITVINLTNKYALYNFLSTFSGTHCVTPRAITAEVGVHF